MATLMVAPAISAAHAHIATTPPAVVAPSVATTVTQLHGLLLIRPVEPELLRQTPSTRIGTAATRVPTPMVGSLAMKTGVVTSPSLATVVPVAPSPVGARVGVAHNPRAPLMVRP